MEFIGQLSDDEDLRFTANRDFWKDFLKGEMDIESLKEKYVTEEISEKRSTEIKVSNFKKYETANYQFVPEPDIGSGGMRILKNGQLSQFSNKSGIWSDEEMEHGYLNN